MSRVIRYDSNGEQFLGDPPSLAEVMADVDDLREGKIPADELNGRVLDIVGSIRDLDGEVYSDEQCLWMIHDVINKWSEIADEGGDVHGF